MILNVESTKSKEIASTKSTFHSKNLKRIWNIENGLCHSRNEKYKKLNYTFPELRDSKFATDDTALLKANICQDLYWSNDGSSIITVNDDYGIREYLVPNFDELDNIDNLNERDQLLPFTRFFRSQSIISSALNKRHSLYNEESNLNILAIGSRNLPIQLYQLSDKSCESPIFTYNTTNVMNEAFEVPFSLDFVNDQYLLSGTIRNKVCLYNISRKYPVSQWYGTGNKITSKSIVSCFDESFSNKENMVKYCGTYNNKLFRIDFRGKKELKYIFSTQHGNGFSQILLSINEQYIYAIKRSSDCIDVIDVRKSDHVASQLQLPFTMDLQKYKGYLSPTNGLTIGTDNGHAVNWSSALTEFGGQPRTRLFTCNESIQINSETNKELLSFGARINIIKECPVDSNLTAISYSDDKFSADTNDSLSFHSGISLYANII
ncbi:hypothetical protein TBLA_0B00740 [Henningerozyma blattae CBS 6284]|uniref:Protein SWT21 n=1 Tax=Henningerozyma blattae (strain ATCC 34711 / CBS 6284 / DSM 70876 / NBRC 10599 / NRRL Y-10934 / UCD 77-7) TaxID=1071380 RepID=I2GXR5_HENB6|nr:hypothetical protein TBLA_0B00740 [Tetrapisispora blattae CBS 6284]CCH58917.1 hypothetical protein TBLA_0B00740 [Tetrapisispora blattae CBS 6284]